MIEADAPGKLVVSGEYAVLEGAPAIAVAMPVRAGARVAAAAGSELVVAGDARWGFRWRDGLPGWDTVPPGGQGRLLEALAATLADDGAALAEPLRIELDTRAFFRADAAGRVRKLGLGSSAALTVALAAALLAYARGGEPASAQAVAALAHRAHRRFQGGAGSGIDVAAAVQGGVVRLDGADGRTHALRWPPGLAWLAVWSGESASTPALLARLAAFRERDAAQWARHRAELRSIAARIAADWDAAPPAALLESLAGYATALRSLDAAAGIGIVTPAHEQIARLAREAGALYKTSGAGGGDFGLAFAASVPALERFAGACRAAGFPTLAGVADDRGVCVRSP
jgi:phosphomevalonate kinase